MLSEEEVAALKALYGRAKYVTFNGVDLVFRKPKRTECQSFMMKREASPAEKVAADEQLAQQLIVVCGTTKGPDLVKVREAFKALLEDWPLLVNEKGVGSALSQLVGLTQDEEAKSLGDTSKASGDPQMPTPAA
jgi:hypothetical protein